MNKIIFICSFSLLAFVNAQSGCPSGKRCMPLRQCAEFQETRRLLASTTDENKSLEYFQQIKKNLCGTLTKRINVCCDADSQGSSGLAVENDEMDVPEGMLKFNKLTYHPLAGTVEFKNENTLRIKNFIYDGLGPDAFFIVGKSGLTPDPSNAIPVVPNAVEYPQKEFSFRDNNVPILRKYDGEDLEIKLPIGIRVSDLKWISLFCRDYNIDFGHVIFPERN